MEHVKNILIAALACLLFSACAEADELPDETVSNEFKKGYKIGDRVLRPSMVCVARSTK